MSKSAEINIKIELDARNVPVDIQWYATDAQMDGYKEARSMSLSLWDPKENRTLNMGLWTNQMLVGDMNTQLFETLMNMADSYERATGFSEIAESLRSSAKELAQKMAELNRDEQ